MQQDHVPAFERAPATSVSNTSNSAGHEKLVYQEAANNWFFGVEKLAKQEAVLTWLSHIWKGNVVYSAGRIQRSSV